MDKDIYLKKLGDTIKEIRISKNLSQDAIADATNLERSYVSGIELGKRNPSAYTLFLLATALKINICDFFKFLR